MKIRAHVVSSSMSDFLVRHFVLTLICTLVIGISGSTLVFLVFLVFHTLCPQTLDSGRFDTATRSYSLTRRSRARDAPKRYHSNQPLVRHHSTTLHPPRYVSRSRSAGLVSRSQSARVSAFKPLRSVRQRSARYHDGKNFLMSGVEDDGYDPDDYSEGGLMRSSSSALCRPHVSCRAFARVSWSEGEMGRSALFKPPVLKARADLSWHVHGAVSTCKLDALSSDDFTC